MYILYYVDGEEYVKLAIQTLSYTTYQQCYE